MDHDMLKLVGLHWINVYFAALQTMRFNENLNTFRFWLENTFVISIKPQKPLLFSNTRRAWKRNSLNLMLILICQMLKGAISDVNISSNIKFADTVKRNNAVYIFCIHTYLPLSLSHPSRVPFLGMLTTILFLHSLGKISDPQHLPTTVAVGVVIL